MSDHDDALQRVEPVLVRGATIVAEPGGDLHRVRRPVVALCRCGRSRLAPWCDSTHKLLARGEAADQSSQSDA